MIVLVPRSERLLEDLRALPSSVKLGMKVKKHPDQPSAIVVLETKTWPADRAAEELVKQHGTVRWKAGAFVFERPQDASARFLTLFPLPGGKRLTLARAGGLPLRFRSRPRSGGPGTRRTK